KREGKVGISLVGCGNHVLGKHLPNLRSMKDVELRYIASATGKTASVVAERNDATAITTDVGEVMRDPSTDGVMICSTQPEHYEHIVAALDAGKAIFVEKPMVTRLDHFQDVLRRMERQPVLFTLGLNRRFSGTVEQLREVIDGPVASVEYVVTQPFVPADHWTLDPVDGGGRLITEGEHFIDLCNYLIGASPASVFARALGKTPDDLRTLCNFAVTLHYPGAVANIVFSESGAARYPRESVTLFGRGQIAVMDDFAKLTVHGRKVKSYGTGLKKSMGHAEELEEFVRAIRGEQNKLLTWEGASLATLCMFAAQESIRIGDVIGVDEFRERLLSEPAPQ